MEVEAFGDSIKLKKIQVFKNREPCQFACSFRGETIIHIQIAFRILIPPAMEA